MVGDRRPHGYVIGVCFLGWIGAPAVAFAQAGTGPMTLNEAIQLALKNYPALKESRAREESAVQAIGVARTAYLPRLDLIWQTNRATTNNVFGLVLPQGIVPPISGPVLGTTSNSSVWGSAAGVLLSWQAFDFGLRRANVDVAGRR
jgi:outer membrane protein